ncbi:hypothetical protein [Pseudalkalibacillus hwajinpoensis]|uniref:hypothetical protein n=1 Tax=Guptibacillus hwajinpoensis TaxID=208199 RepID=UPI001CD7C563|nr:hypothetical protein [Pseudalkalibacillus hwajinpoensis]MCA0992497.1 hypothetical protein [Pseudalkalibacillus hwajinpoensis]
MKKSTMLFTSITLAATVLAACGNDSENAANTGSNSQEQTNSASKSETKSSDMTIESAATTKQVEAYQEMLNELNNMKEEKEVDWDLIESTYSNELKSAVNEIDSEFDTFITTGIQAGKSGEIDQNVARQMIDKGTQSYFYQKQKSLQQAVIDAKDAGKDEEAMLHFEEVKMLAEKVFVPTAEKRDSYYELEGDSSLVENINNGLSAQEDALSEGDMENFSVTKQVTDKSIYKSYYLAANSYAEKIQEAVGSGETEELQIMQTEALGFYQAIKGSLSGGDEEAAQKLSELFDISNDPEAIKADEVSNLFEKAFAGKIKGYHEKVAELDENNLSEGKEAAMEANVFLKAIEMPLMEALGEDETNAVYEDAQSWFDAVSDNDAEEANKLSEQILTTLESVVE